MATLDPFDALRALQGCRFPSNLADTLAFMCDSPSFDTSYLTAVNSVVLCGSNILNAEYLARLGSEQLEKMPLEGAKLLRAQ